MPFTNPLVAGTTLIRAAINSPDYVAGVSGWSINKDGTAEFNSVTVRGMLEVDGPDGSKVDVITGGSTRTGAHIEIRSNDFPGEPIVNAAIVPGYIDAFTDNSTGTAHRIITEFFGGGFNNGTTSGVRFWSQPYELSTINYIDFTNYINDGTVSINFYGPVSLVHGGDVNGTLTIDTNPGSTGKIVDGNGHEYARSESGKFSHAAWTSLSTWSVAVTFANSFDNPPCVYTNMESTAGGTLGWITRAWAITTTGFTFFAQQAANTASTTTAPIQFSWTAVEKL